jgi:glycosyltransferase involved in cell wall biosynthesis
MSTISVVVTTYNRAHLLPRAIKSIHDAGGDLEIIVVDDASSDATHEICATLSGIRYLLLRTNHGLAHARNVGIAASSSDFIAFLDDDDLRLPGSLDRQLKCLSIIPTRHFVMDKLWW